MTAPYRCEHAPRCECADMVESLHRQLCDALNDRNLERDKLRAIESMVVARVGGEVEGAPTTRLNYLQRIDALRAIEEREVT